MVMYNLRNHRIYNRSHMNLNKFTRTYLTITEIARLND